ncbi:kinase-like domain-containing protein [Xylaria castorea]|nr:kinase-like domain-containing protein [Xylaria castorea]
MVLPRGLLIGSEMVLRAQPNSTEQSAVVVVLSAEERQREREQADEARRVVRDHFNNLTSFQYEQAIGSGMFGVAYSVMEKRLGRRARRLVVKRAQTELAENELRDEIRMMTKLNGSAHIAAVIAAKDDHENTQLRPGIVGRLVSKITSREKDMLVGLPGPTLVLEHLENGTVHNLMGALGRKTRTLPNRVLWSFFLCLVRACIAMRSPPEQPYGAKPELEEISETRLRSSITHSDMHSGNILLGSAGDFPEHAVIPPMKLIDFGLSYTGGWGEGDSRNLLDAGKQIYYLIMGRYRDIGFRHELHNGVNTNATEILPRNGQEPYPMLDTDLRNLVARCLAMDPTDRPSLAEALGICKNALETRTPGFYGFHSARETDYLIRHLLQEIVYDAN